MILTLVKVTEGIADQNGKQLKVFMHEFALANQSLGNNQDFAAVILNIASEDRLEYVVGINYEFGLNQHNIPKASEGVVKYPKNKEAKARHTEQEMEEINRALTNSGT